MRARAALTALLAALLPASVQPWSPPPASAEPAPTAIYEALGLRGRPADLVVLLDTSGSMRSQQKTVERQLKGLLLAKGEHDAVTLVRFDRRPHRTGVLEGDEDVDALPAPTGEFSDLGRALAWVVHRVAEQPTRLTAVMLISDGIQDPAPGSPYGRGDGPAWKELRGQAAKLKPQPLVFSFPIGDAEIRRHQDEIIERVFPQNAQILDPREAQARKDLSRLREEALRAEARRLVAPDLTRGVDLRWQQSDVRLDPAEGTATLTLDVRSETEVLPLELRSVEVTVSAGDRRMTGRSTAPAPIPLRPDGTVSVPIQVSWDKPPLIPMRPFVIELDRTVQAAVRLATPWESDLRLLGLSFGEREARTETARGSGAMRGEPAYWVFALAAVLLVALLMSRFMYVRAERKLPPKMRGLLWSAYLHAAGEEWKEHKLGPVRLGGHRRVRTGDLAPALELPGGTAQGSVEVRAAPDDGVTITYYPDATAGRNDTADCPPGQKVMINGVEFIHKAMSEDG
ncbi:VWA domain-containing protein [Nonomuraea sp. PA05]|uniref:vWA domain-containing protein n=1 Tax=Nonomuraea sp. PA05 TaxID=2604466 RepID=UPI0011DAA489|nr:vWA domain-containing protein [Nonomuraea sp. PA05]TYB61751.1 VWA domain-containing protein [Nonomuraea sp. PA05]